MPYQIGTATDYKDLLVKLRDFVMTPNTLGSVVPDPGNTGDGTVTGVSVVSLGPVTTISASATDNSFNDSASGFGSFIPGQWLKASGFVNNANNKHVKIVSVTVSKIVVSGATLVTEVAGPSIFFRASAADDAAVSETWTLTCTAGGATGTFSVVGSVSGAKADVTVGTPYDNGIVAFTINDGAADFVIDDAFTFDVTKVMGEEHWVTKRWNANYDGLNGYEWIAFGPGSGDDEIYIGIQTFFNATDGYFDWRLNGFTGYSAPAVWASQPGAIPNNSSCYYPNVYLWNTSIPYWFVANGRRFVSVAKLGGVYESCYGGFILPYGLPNQWSYPLVIGGSAPSNLVTPNKRYDSQNFCHRAFVDPAGAAGQGSLCLFSGTDWINFRNWSSETNAYAGNNVWPFIHSDYNYNLEANSKFLLISRNIDGSFPVFPLGLISNSPTKNCFGELQGCFAAPDTPPVSGDPLVVEDTITIAGKTYLVVQNIFRTNYWTYWTLLLE